MMSYFRDPSNQHNRGLMNHTGTNTPNNNNNNNNSYSNNDGNNADNSSIVGVGTYANGVYNTTNGYNNSVPGTGPDANTQGSAFQFAYRSMQDLLNPQMPENSANNAMANSSTHFGSPLMNNMNPLVQIPARMGQIGAINMNGQMDGSMNRQMNNAMVNGMNPGMGGTMGSPLTTAVHSTMNNSSINNAINNSLTNQIPNGVSNNISNSLAIPNNTNFKSVKDVLREGANKVYVNNNANMNNNVPTSNHIENSNNNNSNNNNHNHNTRNNHKNAPSNMNDISDDKNTMSTHPNNFNMAMAADNRTMMNNMKQFNMNTTLGHHQHQLPNPLKNVPLRPINSAAPATLSGQPASTDSPQVLPAHNSRPQQIQTSPSGLVARGVAGLNTSGTTGEMRCVDCTQTFFNNKDLRRHQKSEHDRQTYKCRKCGELFLTIADRQTHKNNKHFPQIQQEVKQDNFLEFAKGTVLRATRNDKGAFECPSNCCSFATRIPSYWYDHIRTVDHCTGEDPQKKKKSRKIKAVE